jgi:hypothetical protein
MDICTRGKQKSRVRKMSDLLLRPKCYARQYPSPTSPRDPFQLMFKLVTSIPGRSESAYVHIPEGVKFVDSRNHSAYQCYTKLFSELSGSVYCASDRELIWNHEYFLLPGECLVFTMTWGGDGILRYRVLRHGRKTFPVLAKKIDWDVIRFQEFFGS